MPAANVLPASCIRLVNIAQIREMTNLQHKHTIKPIVRAQCKVSIVIVENKQRWMVCGSYMKPWVLIVKKEYEFEGVDDIIYVVSMNFLLSPLYVQKTILHYQY